MKAKQRYALFRDVLLFAIANLTCLPLSGHIQQKKEHWLPYFQYQSHDPEFDFLKSLEIEAKINQIKFCRSYGGNNMLLSANGKDGSFCSLPPHSHASLCCGSADKTIKLWKISQRRKYSPNAVESFHRTGQLHFPRRTGDGTGKRSVLLAVWSGVVSRAL
jgi:hypothetical protein